MPITYHYTPLTEDDIKAIIRQRDANIGIRTLSGDELDQAVGGLISRYLTEYPDSSSTQQDTILFKVLTCPPEDCLLYTNLDKEGYSLSSMVVQYRLERGI